jgi:hypothetical protein
VKYLLEKIMESQPIASSILQNLISAGLNEHDILMAFNIFKTDLCNNMPYGDRTYLERLSIDLTKYPTVRDTMQDWIINIDKEIHIDKLAIVKSNLEAFLFSLVTTIYFYSRLFNAEKVQIQKNLIKRILIICVFNYFLPLIPLFIVIKEPKKSVRSQFKIEQKNNKINNNINKKRRKKK